MAQFQTALALRIKTVRCAFTAPALFAAMKSNQDRCLALAKITLGTSVLRQRRGLFERCVNPRSEPDGRKWPWFAQYDCAAMVGQPVDQSAPDADYESAESEKEPAGTEGDIERHVFNPRW